MVRESDELIMATETYTTNSFAETQKIGEAFGKTLRGGEVICLHGDLGHGKTTFVQGLAKGLGITGKILSPTFIIMRSYKAETVHFYHVDLYRIGSEQEIVDLGLTDFMQNQENILAIEWPEKMGSLLPEKRIDILFEYLDENKRKIQIHTYA